MWRYTSHDMQSYILGAQQPVNAIMSEKGYTDVGTLSFSSAILGQAVIVEINGASSASYLKWSDVNYTFAKAP